MQNYFEALATGAGNVFGWPNILLPTFGTLLAMVVAFLPGVGGPSVMAVLLVVTLTWDPVQVLLLYGALVGGATFMGSVTAILFNIPGGPPNAATLLDGYPLARSGYPRTAIAAAATASAVGSVIGVVVLMALLPVIRPLLLEFGPLERLLLGLWGLSTIVALPTKSVLKSAIMGLLGLIAAMVGVDPVYAAPRWAFGSSFVTEGLSLIPVLLGLFTLTELIGWNSRIHLDHTVTLGREHRADDSTLNGILAVFRHPLLTLRSSMIGTIVGLIPGVGGTVASFIAYGSTVQTARGDRSNFGKGDIRGLIAPEAAVDAKDGGSLLPTLAFGLPGSEGGAILLTVLVMHGLIPGIPMLTEQLPLTFTLILALLFSNILTSVVGVALTPALARLPDIRTDGLAVGAVVISLFSIVVLRGQQEDLYVAIAFGVAGFLLKQHDWPRVPFIIAFLLGDLIERNTILTARLLDLGRLSLFDRPAAIAIMALIVASVVWMRLRPIRVSPATPTRGDAVTAIVLLAIVSLLGIVALLPDNRYGLIPLAAVGGAFVLLLLATVLYARASWRATRPAAPAADGSTWLPVALLLLFAPCAMLIGAAPALGLMTAGWLLLSTRRTGTGIALAIGAGLAVGIASHLLFFEVFHLLLPRPLLRLG